MNTRFGPLAITLLICSFSAARAEAVSVCLDPGHGGSDPGAVGLHCQEKVANLSVGFDARSYLQQVSGVSVGMTRASDTTVSLADRAAYANSHGFDRFMSVHHNAFDSTVQGTETFCYTSGSSHSFNLRGHLHGWLLWAHGYYDRGVKTASFYVLRETTMPAVLGEASFIDYRGAYDESYRLCHDEGDHIGREGYAYAAGLCDHYGLSKPPYGDVEFTLDLDTRYSWGTLSLDFTLGLPEAATWETYLVLTYPASEVLRIWSVLLPRVQPPADIPVSFALPTMSWVGIWSGLFTAGGYTEAMVFEWVDTGF